VKFNFHSSAPSFYHFAVKSSSTKDFIGLSQKDNIKAAVEKSIPIGVCSGFPKATSGKS